MNCNLKNNALEEDFLLCFVLLPFVLSILAISCCETTNIDLSLADRYFDFVHGLWPARHKWWSEQLVHRWGRDLVEVVFIMTTVAAIASYPRPSLVKWRWTAIYLLLAIAVSTGTVEILKQLTGQHSPWDLQRYGGSFPYVPLFHKYPEWVPRGKSFPGGHASAGYSLFAFYFALRDRNPFWARVGLAIGSFLGSLFGYAQMVRGAHFLSHTLWSAAICWFSTLGLYMIFHKRLTKNVDTEQQPGL